MPELRFRLFGFPITISGSIAILAAVYFLFGLQAKTPLSYTAATIVVIVISILIHELGHAYAAKGLGLGTSSIVIHGFGGLARPEKQGTPWQHLLVSLAGPAAGLTVGFIAWLLDGVLTLKGLGNHTMGWILFANIGWSILNLLPLFPLDGGQALMSFLAIVTPKSAIPVTTGLGLVGGAAMGLGGWFFFHNIFFAFIGGFVIQHNWQMLQRWRQRSTPGPRWRGRR